MGARDEFLLEIVERAMEPYRGHVAADVFDQMRELLTAALATHPVASRIVDRARPRTGVYQSDDYEAGTLNRRKGSDEEDPGSSERGPA